MDREGGGSGTIGAFSGGATAAAARLSEADEWPACLTRGDMCR
jgi:hypothetical protein